MLSDEDRKAFEEWYAYNAFDYVANPIGSRECGLQWKAWQAGVERGKAERAKYEFICDRCGIRQQAKEQPEGAPF